MKKGLILALMAVLTMGAAGIENAAAQKFELGIRGGIAAQSMDTKAIGLINGKSNPGWHAAVATRFRIIGFGGGLLGAGLYVQPEVVYSQSSFKGDPIGGDEAAQTKINLNTVDAPLLLSVKLSLFRIQFGPVFNLMNNFNTTGGELEFQPLRSAMGYALGASIDLGPLVIDGRYHGDFKDMSFKGSVEDIKSRFSSWSVGVGLMF